MKKILLTFVLIVSVMVSVFAQAPQKFSYQAVVRDAGNNLVASQAVGVRISILQGGVTGNAVYMESQTITTNANGLMTVVIGNGTTLSGDIASIDWADGPYFLKTETDPDGGTNYTIEGTQQLMSVPYALYAGSTANGFSGSYNDLTDQPTIPTVPTNVSAFTNDAGYLTTTDVQEAVNIPTVVSAFQNDVPYLTSADIPAPQVLSISNDTIYLSNGGFAVLPAGFDGDYNSLTNRPTLFSGSYNDLTDQPELFSGNYNDLTNQPTIPTVPTNVSDFANDASYVNNADCNNVSFCDLLNMLTALQNTVDSLAAVVAGNNPAPCAPTSSIHNIEITTDELPYAFGDTTFLAGTATGTYVLVRANAAGCDSTITINLTVNEPAEDFICGTSTITDADNNTYNTVQIGEQCWMKENLKTTQYADGTPIENGSTTSYDTAYWYYPNNEEANKATYGLLYNWKAVMGNSSSSDANPIGVQGICPDGWHVPSDAEWTQLTNYVSSQSWYVCGSNNTYIAKALAGTTGWSSSTNTCAVGNTPGQNNATGFCALPAGYYNSSYNSFGINANFWSATENSSDFAHYRHLNYNVAGVYRYNYTKSFGYSVRCVRDIAEEATEPCAPTSSIHNIEITTDELPYAFGDTTFLAGTETGTYVLVRTNAAGCDSTITVNLTISAPAFTCGTSTISDVDGNTYNTVQIGEQCWMKENLRTTKKPNGTTISSGIWAPGSNSVTTYGRLYSWSTVMNGAPSSNANPSGVQGICPDGWHVPSDNEWKQMEMAAGMSQSDADTTGWRGNIAAKLSGNTGWNSSTTANAAGNLNAPDRNSTGFSALPAGFYDSSYYNFGNCAYFWSATENSSDHAYHRGLTYTYAGVARRYYTNKTYGFSVRCVRD